MLAPAFALVVLNQTEPDGLLSSVVFQVGLLVCLSCNNVTPLKVPAVIPKSAKSVPVTGSNLIVFVPAVESPSAIPLWNISRLPVTALTEAVDPEATETTGNDACHSLDPICTQVLLAVFLKILFETFVVLIAYEPIDPTEVSGAPVETPPTRSATADIKIGVIVVND